MYQRLEPVWLDPYRFLSVMEKEGREFLYSNPKDILPQSLGEGRDRLKLWFPYVFLLLTLIMRIVKNHHLSVAKTRKCISKRSVMIFTAQLATKYL